jgi:hypothetical protein
MNQLAISKPSYPLYSVSVTSDWIFWRGRRAADTLIVQSNPSINTESFLAEMRTPTISAFSRHPSVSANSFAMKWLCRIPISLLWTLYSEDVFHVHIVDFPASAKFRYILLSRSKQCGCAGGFFSFLRVVLNTDHIFKFASLVVLLESYYSFIFPLCTPIQLRAQMHPLCQWCYAITAESIYRTRSSAHMASISTFLPSY